MSESEAIALIIFFLATATVAITLITVRYAQRRLRTRERLKALEHGQPLPVETPRSRRRFADDLRTGVLLISFSVGLYLFIWLVSGGDHAAAAVALVPFFIGIGYLTNAVIGRRYDLDRDEDTRAGTPPRAPLLVDDDPAHQD